MADILFPERILNAVSSCFSFPSAFSVFFFFPDARNLFCRKVILYLLICHGIDMYFCLTGKSVLFYFFSLFHFYHRDPRKYRMNISLYPFQHLPCVLFI